jgi:predicted nicotinamide N-methyase
MLIEACRRQDAGEAGVIDPFWATVWRAAAGLDRFLDGYALAGMRVLELGCGTGHAGISAALRQAQVTLTDGVSEPLLLARMSSWPIRDHCRIRRLRFGVDRLENEGFPLVLGSDVTYLRTLWKELDVSLRQHLAEDGEVLLSDPLRGISSEFRDQLDCRYWDYQEHRVELPDQPGHPIRVMRLRRR